MTESLLPENLPWYGYCPVQIEGEIDGYHYYFRARGTRWTFQIADVPHKDPIDAPNFMEGRIDAEFAAGWMPHPLARALVDWALAVYQAERSRSQ